MWACFRTVPAAVPSSSAASSEGRRDRVRALRVEDQLDRRYELSMDEYENLLTNSQAVKFGTRNVVLDTDFLPQARLAHGTNTLFLTEIREFQRLYDRVPSARTPSLVMEEVGAV
jgi:polyketide biosynthesis 3-hydroxy-3-methylglutaryl-CoA synthase-like enzyme PksG